MLTEALNQLKPWLVWIHIHPEWLSLATFLLALIECLAIVGFVVPGTVIMTALGALIGSSVVTAQMVFIPAMLGAFVGDVLSFFIGRHYRERLRDMWPFKFYPTLLQKGESFFYRHGGKSVFTGRFVGPIRPLLPIIAGMLNMSPWRFLIVDAISAIFWAPVYMLPGIALGAASVALPSDVALHFMLYVILILLVLWCVSWLIKRFIAWIVISLHKLLDEIWFVIKDKPWLRPLSIALRDPLHPESHAQLTLGLYLLFTAGLFVFVAWQVFQHHLFTDWNYSLFYLLRTLRNPVTDKVMLIVTLLSDPKVWLGVFVVMLLWLVYERAWRTVAHWVLIGVFGFVGAELLKLGIHSPRPAGLLVALNGYSFPSGHVTLSTVVAGFFAVLLARALKPADRWIPYTVLVVLVLCIGFSRLYLGAHWLSDVIGGMLYGATTVMLVTLSYRRELTPHLKPWVFLTVFLSSWLVIGTAYTITHYKKALHNYSLYIPATMISMEDWWAQNGMQEPLYRLNRTGKPAQVLNVQWVGDLQSIEQGLLMHGWTTSPNTMLSMVLNRINKQSNGLVLPILPQLYLDQRPALVMSKQVSAHVTLVLSLWDAHTLFSDTSLPLWLGNVTYYHNWPHSSIQFQPEKEMLPAVSAIATLSLDLQNYVWKEVNYSPLLQDKKNKIWWDGQLLLIQPNTEENS